jgi:hypothetical protein
VLFSTIETLVAGGDMNGTMQALGCSQQLKFLLQVEI